MEAQLAGTAESTEQTAEQGYKHIEEITLKFGKGCVGDEFTGKDGNTYREILIPNQDEHDKRPWQTFVVKSNHVHENQYGTGMLCKLPAEGHTTVHRGIKVGETPEGKGIWETQKTTVTNKELKAMVEAYKERPRESVQEKLAEKVGISPSFLGHIERGTRVSSLETLVSLCNGLCVTPEYLLSASLHEFDSSMPSGLTEAERIRLSEFLRLAQDTVRNWKA